MELKDILSKCDHTLLAQTATWEEIRTLCDDGIRSSQRDQIGRAHV